MKLIICGDSHTEALIEGFGLLATDRPQLRNDVAMKSLGRGRYLAQPFAAEASGGAVAFTYDEYAESYTSFGAGPLRKQDGLMHGFCMAFHSAPLFRNPMWRGYAPWRICGDGETPVSDAVLDAMSDHVWRDIRFFFELLLKQNIPFFVIAAPPPRRSHSCIIEDGISPRIVHEVDRHYRASVKRWLDARGIPAMLPPADTVDADGFLLPDYEPRELAHDFHHANARYGAKFMREILTAQGILLETDACAASPAS